MIAFQVLLHHLLLPLIFLVWLWAGRPASRVQWLGSVALTTAYILAVSIIGAWAWVGYPLRFLILGFLVAALIGSYRRTRSVSWTTAGSWKVRLDAGFRFLLALVFAAGAVYGLAGYSVKGEAISLSFPLKERVYVVGQGGATPLINYHNVHRAQKYALDIVGLNAFGLRARGLYPSELERYAIYGDTVFSPCAGVVARTSDGMEDHAPPGRDQERPAGNMIALECAAAVVYLAHLQSGSVRVESGDRVQEGHPLGVVGNSGNTSEPHLHIHAEHGPYTGDSKPGVPIRFGRRFLVRNSLVW